MTLYYDINGFHERKIDALDNAYETTKEYQQQLLNQINMNHSINANDVWRIVPDKNGKPIVVEIELDMRSVFRKKRRAVFDIINRGQPWYNTLTDKKKQELQVWYQAWLDITVTLKEPVKPSWLN